MTEWINRVCDRVDQLTAEQPYFQELLARHRALEPQYQEILSSLPQQDAEILIEYLYLTTEMDYQKTQTAYAYGCRRR